MSELTDPIPGSPETFGIVREDRGEAVVLAVSGEVDTLTAPRLTATAADVVAEEPRVLVLDLSAVEFLASPGLTALLTIRRDIGEKTTLRIVAAGRACLRPIQLTGLDAGLPLFPTLDAALAG